ADGLRKLGVRFTLDIAGGGTLDAEVRASVAQLGLTDHVRFHGVLDFHDQLLPLIKERADLFVCCHRQGDPSCTYLETFACGTPIAGYANGALDGLSRLSGAAFLSPMD